MTIAGDVAIVGMACLFPGAPDLDTFATNLAAGRDAIGDVPAGRWDPAFHDPASRADDRFYARRGGFVDDLAAIDPARLGVMPRAAASVEPDQLLALEVALRALADAGLDRKDFDRDRAGVILGRGNYAGAGRTRLDWHVRGAEQLVRALRSLVPGVSEDELARVKRELQAQVGWAGADAAIGLVPNLTASRVAHRLDLGGPAYTVDAACASALLAVDHAVTELRAGRLDVVLAGGVHFCHDETFWSVFCQLGAISRRGAIRPFDRAADGVLIGEGCGVVVLRRRTDAERDGDRIYAVIRGTGTSSDGRASLLAPHVDGQVKALTRAWRDAGADPATVGLVEAHGTATPAGDAAELETLRRVFGEPRGARAALGSVKSMIGHAMPAAGAAGLIKAALALHRAELLPTLHCDDPRAELAATRFEAQTALAPWPGGRTRRAAVNAFGFGGINAHVVLEEASPAPRRRRRVTAPVSPLVRLSGTPDEIAARLDGLAAGAALPGASRDPGPGGPARLAIVDPTPERIARARKAVLRGAPWRGRDGIFFAPEGLLAGGGRLCFAYPGVDADFRPRLDDVADDLGWALAPELTSAAEARSIERVGAGLVAAGRLLTAALDELGVAPELACGHSVGEWTAMAATGMLRADDVEALAADARAGALEVPGVVFAAAGSGADRARAALDGLPDVAVSHDNCPHQVILCGVEASVAEALRRLRAGGVLGQILPFRSGFHAPWFAPYLDPHRANFARLAIAPPRVPLWSATTCAPYPDDPDEVRALSLRHLVEPVRFRELVERMYAEGARVFVQVGPGSLVPFIEDTLRGRPHLAITANAPDRAGLDQLVRVAAALWCEGASPRLERLLGEPEAAAATPSRGTMKVPLSVPLVSFAAPLRGSGAGAPRAADSDAARPGARGELASLLDEIAAAGAAVAAVTPAAAAPPRVTVGKTRVVRRLSVDTHPWLLDHTFMRQPPGWPTVSDRHPVVPMTTTIQRMIDEVTALAPGRVAVAIEQVRALRWIAVPAPTDLTFAIDLDGDRARVVVEGFAEATVVLADAYPPAPPFAPAPLPDARPTRVDAVALYRDRWMFHGPAFQGVRALGPTTDAAIRGRIEAGAAPGALLDNAGQIYGYWVMERAERDRLAMPVGIARARFFGPHPAAGTMVDCDVAIRAFEARRVVADLALGVDGRTWCAIDGWEDRRFDTDDRLWDVLIWPERHLLARPMPGGPVAPVIFDDTYRAAPTREQLMRRYLGERERAVYEAQPPRGQRAHLAGRIAAKDAVRHLLRAAGDGPRFPVEIEVDVAPGGRPVVRAPDGRDVRVSIAHKDDVAVALAAAGRDVGVDLERVEPRTDAFAAVAFHPSELALAIPGEDPAEWMTRLWTAKEAVGKLLGTGLGGNPRRLRVVDRTSGRTGDLTGVRLLCEGHHVHTVRRGDHVIAWTIAPPTEPS